MVSGPARYAALASSPTRPVAGSWLGNHLHLDLFVSDNSGRVMTISYAPVQFPLGQTPPVNMPSTSWGAWAAIPGVSVAPRQPITAVWRNPNHLDLFTIDRSGQVMSIYFENGRWQPAWFPINPNSGAAGPGQQVAAVWRNANHLDLFITGKDGKVMSTFFDKNKWQSAWFPINPQSGVAAPGQTVTALWRNANHLDLFITAADGRILSTFFDDNK